MKKGKKKYFSDIHIDDVRIDYYKKYQEALQRAKQFSEKPYLEDSAGIVEYIFPELKESEDEKIRKMLIQIVNITPATVAVNNRTELIAWLEKQKPIDESETKELFIQAIERAFSNGRCGVNISDCDKNAWWEDFKAYGLGVVCQKQEEQKPAELIKEYNFHGIKIVPKFKKGDLIRKKLSGRILTIKDFSYDTGLYTYDTGQFPITIQDRYEFVEQKPAWSEDDEMFVHGLIRGLTAKRDIHGHTTFSSDCIDITETINWLKSLKDRVQPNPDWSKEDRRMLFGLIDELDAIMNKATPNEISVYSKYTNWLESLRPQNRWKPSEGQLECLGYAIEKAEKDWSPLANNRIYLTLKSLKEQLEKL